MRQGWSVERAGRESEISARTWARWEKGKVTPYVGAKLARAAATLGVTVTWLLTGEE
jgi:transcriptional regulator with XRE-family HTH domain